MPSFVPRQNPIKKKEELAKREYEFTQALKKNLTGEKLVIVIEKYRKAVLSLLKARVHTVKEKEYKSGTHNQEIDHFENEITTWKNKTNEEIIAQFKLAAKII